MVLCHGGPGGYDYLEPVAAMVDDLCRVLRLPMPVLLLHGAGDPRPAHYIETLAARRRAFIAEVEAGVGWHRANQVQPDRRGRNADRDRMGEAER